MRPDIYYYIYDWAIHKLQLSGAQLLVLCYLYEVHKTDQKPRTGPEIAYATGYSSRQIYRANAALLERGLLKRTLNGDKAYFRVDVNTISRLAW